MPMLTLLLPTQVVVVVPMDYNKSKDYQIVVSKNQTTWAMAHAIRGDRTIPPNAPMTWAIVVTRLVITIRRTDA